VSDHRKGKEDIHDWRWPSQGQKELVKRLWWTMLNALNCFLSIYSKESRPDELARAHVKIGIAKITVQTRAELQSTVMCVIRRL